MVTCTSGCKLHAITASLEFNVWEVQYCSSIILYIGVPFKSNKIYELIIALLSMFCSSQATEKHS